MMHFKLLEKQEQTKPKTSRQTEIIKDQCHDQWDQNQTNYTKKQLNEKLVLWKD
jgi:hypothetical protein